MSRRPTPLRGSAAPAAAPRATRGPSRGARRPAARVEATPVRVARLLSVRALVLGVVLLAGFSLLFPTVRAYLGQRAELDALAAEVTASEQREEDLRAELDRWGDPAYVAAQARERLSYVMPGETSYRVIDPEIVQDEAPAVEGESGTGPRVPTGADVAPWYTSVWESVRIAGETALPTPTP